jgi:two-component system, OmpR family, response regulator ChvI
LSYIVDFVSKDFICFILDHIIVIISLSSIEEDQQSEEIQFVRSQNNCVCFIKMNEDQRTASIEGKEDPTSMRKYYMVFINIMSEIARSFGASIIKNVSDSLIIYFPRTSNSFDDSAFLDILKCGITMLSAGSAINEKLTGNNKSAATFSIRISADYGKVEVAKSRTSKEEDLFGPTMNLCAKMNSKAPANHMIIGGDLFLVLKSLFSRPSFKHADYQFKEIKGYSISGSFQYPVYLVKSRNNDRSYNISDEYLSALDNKYNIPAPDQKQIPRSSPSDYNIMLIDDEQDILVSFTEGLSIAGYRSEAFSDSQEALEYFSRMNSKFDLVILDLRMPDINGIELYSKFKSINREVKILFISALDVMPELVSMFPEIVKDDMLRKPVEMNDIISNIKRKLPIQE